MASGLPGLGTQISPWLISTPAQFYTALRNTAESGYYSITADLRGLGTIAWPTLPTTVEHRAKVVYGNGFAVSVATTQSADYQAVFRNAHFEDIEIFISKTSATGTNFDLYFFEFCSLKNVSARIDGYTSGYTQGYIGLFAAPSQSVGKRESLVPRVCQNVVFSSGAGGMLPVYNRLPDYSSVTVLQAVVGVGFGISPYVVRVDEFTLAAIDAATAGAFSANGWVVPTGGTSPRPGGTDAIDLNVITYVDGQPVSRPVWVEADSVLALVGMTGVDGGAYLRANIRRGAVFTFHAAEDLGLVALTEGVVLKTNAFYRTSQTGAYTYRANGNGVATGVDAATYDGSAINFGGVTLQPFAIKAIATSSHYTVKDNGKAFTLTLTPAAGGSGPVETGDPGYLEGVVEEIHPMTGLRTALARCEVLAFERKAGGFKYLGSALSDGVGGFRVDTAFYGNGDVFAFAADDPGFVFAPSQELTVGLKVRPAMANGYVYEIFEPGVAGPSEPVWWPDQGDGTEGNIGTARARARPFYQPVGHGPLKMTLLE